jgi:hypothetical protein
MAGVTVDSQPITRSYLRLISERVGRAWPRAAVVRWSGKTPLGQAHRHEGARAHEDQPVLTSLRSR